MKEEITINEKVRKEAKIYEGGYRTAFIEGADLVIKLMAADESAKRKDVLIEKMAELLVSSKIPIQAVIDTAPKGMLTEVENLLSRIDVALQAVKKENINPKSI